MSINAKTVLLCLALLTILIPNATLASEKVTPRETEPSSYTNTEVKFVVYPEGTVGLAGKYNYTRGYSNTDPVVQAGVQIDEKDDLYNAQMNMTLTVPPKEASQFPFNASKAFMTHEYSAGVLNSNINASIVFPDQFYMGNTMIDFSGFPFNSTDFTINAKCSNQTYNGTITIHIVPGLAIGDIDIHFAGNTSEIVISDSVKIFYNYTLPLPGFPKLDETYVNYLLLQLNSTLPGDGPGSLHNMTGGTLTCTAFSTTHTPIDTNSAEISFVITIQGGFIDALAKVMAGSIYGEAISGPLSDNSVNNEKDIQQPLPPPMLPVFPTPNATTIYSLLNATVYSVKSGDFTMSYSRAAKKLDVQASFTQDLEEYQNATSEIVIEMYPLEIRSHIELLLNTTHSSLHSYIQTLSYENGQMEYKGNYNFEGDINAQVNHVKNVYIDIINALPFSMPEWLMTTLKDTAVDISNLRLNLEVGNFSALWDFEGVKVAPPVDWINATSFRLERFFNITAGLGLYETPYQSEGLKLIVQGGSNGTHTATPFIDPDDPDRVPDPDEIAGGNIMVWRNQGISKLKRLVFNIWEGYAEAIPDPTSITPDNPYTIDAKEATGCMLGFTSVSKQAIIVIRNITEADADPPPETYKLVGSYLQITADPSDAAVNFTLCIYYTPEQLAASRIDENSLRIFYRNKTANEWTPMDTQINTTRSYVWTTVDHLSVWALFGQASPPIWEQPWFLILTAAIVMVAIVVAVLGFRMKKPTAKDKSDHLQ